MTYKSIENGYALFNNIIMIPLKHDDGTTYYWKKEIPFEEVPSYWEYVCEDGMWNIYYVKRGVNRRLAQCNIGQFSPEAIIYRLKDRDISSNECRAIEEHKGRQVERTQCVGIYWSIEYDGKSVFDLMENKQKMPYAHIKMVITNEGGYIDEDGIIHRGTCIGA